MAIVEEHISEMFKVFTDTITTKRMLDVEGKVRGQFIFLELKWILTILLRTF